MTVHAVHQVGVEFDLRMRMIVSATAGYRDEASH